MTALSEQFSDDFGMIFGIKNLSKIDENEVHEAVLGRLWGSLGSCWLKVMSLGPILVGFFSLFRSKMGLG